MNDSNSSRRAESSVLESLDDGFYEVDPDGRFTAVNGALCRLLDRPRHEVFGRRVGELVPGATAECFRPATPGRFVWRLGRSGSMRVLEGSILPLHDEQGSPIGFRGIVRDVTERERMAEDVEAARAAALTHAAAKAEFVAHASHDLRTPMNGIIGMTDLALETDLSEEQREYLTAVRSSAHSLLTLVNDILDFSKMEAGKLELERIPFSLRDSVADALKPLALAAHAKGLELLFEIDPLAPDSIVGDPTRLRQVLINLTDNAIKFTKHGHVLVRVEVEGLDGAEAVLRFRVADTGVGIATGDAEKIFAPFVQTGDAEGRRRGTGLGLAISCKLVKLMGGRIGVESEPGRGSVFCFTAHLALGPAPSRHALASHADLKGLRVLVADGNAPSRQILAEGLRYFGLRVTAVATAEAALSAIAEASRGGHGPFRVAAIDMLLPDLEGFAVAARLRDLGAPDGPRVVLLTRSGQRGDAARCRDLGVAGYLSKPVNPLDLLDAIRAVLGGSTEVRGPDLVTRHSLREAKPRLSVLVAEDDPVNQLVIRTLLEKSGHRATIVGNGEAAVAATDRESFDVVLMDVGMPGLDGHAATRLIRAREAARPGGHLPIVALTAHALAGDEQRAIDAGMDAYLAKPFEPGDLFSVLERVEPQSRRRDPEPGLPSGELAVDRAKLLEQTGGDTALLRQVVEVFLEEKASMLAAVRVAVERGDAAEIARAAHRIKGTCMTLAARLAGEAAAQLERMGRAGDLDQVRGLLVLLDDRVRQVEAELVALVRPWGQHRPA
jgi:PAS domain S-box-containing protein